MKSGKSILSNYGDEIWLDLDDTVQNSALDVLLSTPPRQIQSERQTPMLLGFRLFVPHNAAIYPKSISRQNPTVIISP